MVTSEVTEAMDTVHKINAIAGREKVHEVMAVMRQERDLLTEQLDASGNVGPLDITEYRGGFAITKPMPMIMGGELRLTTQVAELYVDVLVTLADPAVGLIEDEVTCVTYVFNLFTFMDRHWKKIIHDLRTGTLDRHLPVSLAVRKRVDSSLSPMPERSVMLDNILRRLNFHGRASGERERERERKRERNIQCV
jgi:methylglyoxal synthase